jgi:hypothetical protein
MRIGAMLAFIALAAPFRPAVADWQYTKWGMSPEQVVKASAGAVMLTAARPIGEGSADDRSGLEMRAEGTFAAGPLHCDVSFGFDAAGRLAFVTYSIDDPARNGLLKEWLVRRYGQPQSRQGPENDVETWTWSSPGQDSIELNIQEGDSGFVIQYPAEK